MLPTNPHRWPGLKIVAGPGIGGLGVGDVLAVEGPLYLAAPEPPGAPPVRLSRPESDDEAPPWIAASGDGWTGSMGGVVNGAILVAGAWHLEVADDAGVLPTLRRIGGELCARPLGFLDDDGTSLWLSVRDPAWLLAVRGETLRPVRRRVGVFLDGLRRSGRLVGVLDEGRARAIAEAADGAPPVLSIGFDGDVFFDDGRGWTALEHFCRLVGEPLTWERDRERMQARFAAAEAASVDDVAAFARTLDPVGWQREQLLREECAIAAAMG